MVRRVDWNGEALILCRKRSRYARCRLEPKLMNRCEPEKMTKKYGKSKKAIVKLEGGSVPDGNELKDRKEESPGKGAKG